MSPAEARLKEIPSGMTDAEWNQRVNLAACYRLVALYGWDDLVDTHISARVPGPEHHFLINPYGLSFDEVTASSLVKITADGEPVGQQVYKANKAGFIIHSAIHMARPDAQCVWHMHTLPGMVCPPDKGGGERLLRAGGWFSQTQTPRSPRLRGGHDPLVRGSKESG